MSIHLKQQLYNACATFLEERLETVSGIVTNIQESLQSETKSTAGDKHETGRAMLQLEREKAGKQLAAIQEQKALLAKVSIEQQSSVVRLGSMVSTNKGIYFIAISKGLVTIDKKNYFVVAPKAPIGQLLLGKKVGDTITFNGNTITINAID